MRSPGFSSGSSVPVAPQPSPTDSGQVSAGLLPLRSDAPSRLAYRRGSLPDLSSPAARQCALASFDKDIYAASGAGTRAARIRTIGRLLGPWVGGEPAEAANHGQAWWAARFDSDLARFLGASLKAGSYRSAGQYLSTARQVAEAAQGWLPAAVHQVLKGAERSCNRGMGPAKVCHALPLERLAETPGAPEPWTPGGPLSPRSFLVLGSWFLTRELELSSARAVHVKCSASAVTWLLPADKTDSEALGKERTLGCSCNAAPASLCPVHCFAEHLEMLRRRFPDRLLASGKFDSSLPLFPDATGAVISKREAVSTIEHAALLLGLPRERSDGMKVFTGHTLRPTGAQAMARAGLDPWLIGLWGRWGSATVMAYLRDAPLAVSAGFASRTLAGLGPSTGGTRAANSAASSGALTASFSASSLPARRHAEEAAVTSSALKHVRKQLAAIEERLDGAGEGGALRALVTELTDEIEQATLESLRRLRGEADDGLAEARKELTDLAQTAGTAAAQAWLASRRDALGFEAVKASPEGKVHAILIGDLGRPRGEWRSWCGWRFGESTSATRCPLPLSSPSLLCRRCLPEARAKAEKMLAEGAAAAATEPT